jgi:hypothetical protein
MKTRTVPILFLVGSLALLTYAAKDLWAQSSTPMASSAPVTQPMPDPTAGAPQLSYGAEEILKLAQAKVSPDTMVTFVQNSHLNYDLDALGIIYLRQQGVPDPVVTAMLQKSKQVADDAQAAAAAQTTAAAQTAAANTAVNTLATAAPVPQPDAYASDYSSYPAYDEIAPAYDYDYSDYYPYYPYYGYPYPLGFSFGFGYGGYYHGGFHHDFHGGGFRGGTFHGGAVRSGAVGGFHGTARGGSFRH